MSLFNHLSTNWHQSGIKITMQANCFITSDLPQVCINSQSDIHALQGFLKIQQVETGFLLSFNPHHLSPRSTNSVEAATTGILKFRLNLKTAAKVCEISLLIGYHSSYLEIIPCRLSYAENLAATKAIYSCWEFSGFEKMIVMLSTPKVCWFAI